MNKGYKIALGVYFVWLIGLFLVPRESSYFGWYQVIPIALPLLAYFLIRLLVIIFRRFGL